MDFEKEMHKLDMMLADLKKSWNVGAKIPSKVQKEVISEVWLRLFENIRLTMFDDLGHGRKFDNSTDQSSWIGFFKARYWFAYWWWTVDKVLWQHASTDKTYHAHTRIKVHATQSYTSRCFRQPWCLWRIEFGKIKWFYIWLNLEWTKMEIVFLFGYHFRCRM